MSELERLADGMVAQFASTPSVSNGSANGSAHPAAPEAPSRQQTWPAPPGPAARDGLLGEIVGLIEPHSEADPAAVLVQLLVAFGNAVGRGPGYEIEGTFHATNLYGAIVGESAIARKGTSWGRVQQVMKLAAPEWVERNRASGLSSGEGLVWRVRDPLVKRRDATADEYDAADEDGCIEEVEDQGVRDKRLLVVEGELAQALKQLKRDGNTLSIAVRLLWDGGEVDSLTKNSPARTSGALVSIIGHITADELKRELGRTELTNGFANRFLWVCSRRSKSLPDGSAFGADDLRPAANKLAAAITFARSIDHALERTPAARELWHDVYEPLTTSVRGALGHVTARGAPQVLRLAVIYALADRSDVIDRRHLESALAVWDYCRRSAEYIWGDSTGDSLADKVHAALRDAGADGLTRDEIRRLVGGRVSAERIGAALEALRAAGLAHKEVQRGQPGRPPERWYALERVSSVTSVSSTNGRH